MNRYDKTPNISQVKDGEECKCPKCGNSFYIKGSTCGSCGKIMELKRAKVCMLPTENHPTIIVENNNLYWNIERHTGYPHHLYFTTDERYKIGDNVIYNGKVIQNVKGLIKGIGVQKIIASTDPKLINKRINENIYAEWFYDLPQPSQAFIEAYCKQDGIDEVDVEYELIHNGEFINNGNTHASDSIKLKLKVNPIHNTITIHHIVRKIYK